MKKLFFLGLSVLFILSSCVTNKLSEGEEIVEYKDVDYPVLSKNKLTKEEVREDCDMLKYVLYTCYAGIDESIELGLDLDGAVEDIYNKTIKNKIPGSSFYSTDDFLTVIRQKMVKDMHVEDQHLGIGGRLKDSTNLYLSKVYFEKLDDGHFVVKNCDEDKIQIEKGRSYTGPEANLFEMLMNGEIVYRYGVLTKVRVKSINLSVDDEIISVPVKTETAVPQRKAWNGLKTSKDTIYISLSDCYNLSGLEDTTLYTDQLFEKDMQKISEAAKGKKNLIFDLRSNGGGYKEYPAKMLTAAYYCNQNDDDFRKNIEALMLNSISTDCSKIVSPFVMQRLQNVYKNYWKNQFERLSDDVKKDNKKYWRNMKIKPIRKYDSAVEYKCEFDEFPQPDFKGTVYLLVNRYTASAAELGSGMAFLLKDKGIDVKIIGENSSGAVKYVGLWTYCLPNSGIYLSIPSIIGLAPVYSEIPQFMGEGKGFYPDYWATSDNILETLIDCTGDEELESVLEGLNKGLL